MRRGSSPSRRDLGGVVLATVLDAVTARRTRKARAIDAAIVRGARRICADGPDLRPYPHAAIAAAPSVIVRYVRWYVPIWSVASGHSGLATIIATVASAALLLVFRRPLEAVDSAYARWWNKRRACPRQFATGLYRGSDKLSRLAARAMFAGGSLTVLLGIMALAMHVLSGSLVPVGVLLPLAVGIVVTVGGALITLVSMAVMFAAPTLLGPTSEDDLLVDEAVLATLRPAKETLAGRLFEFLLELGKALRRL